MPVSDWAALCVEACTVIKEPFRWQQGLCRSVIALVPSRGSLLLHSPMVRPAVCLPAEGCQSGACGAQRKRRGPAPPNKADMWKRPLFALCMGLVGYWQFTRLRCAHHGSALCPHIFWGQLQTSETAIHASACPVDAAAGGQSLLLKDFTSCDYSVLLILHMQGEKAAGGSRRLVGGAGPAGP